MCWTDAKWLKRIMMLFNKLFINQSNTKHDYDIMPNFYKLLVWAIKSEIDNSLFMLYFHIFKWM